MLPMLIGLIEKITELIRNSLPIWISTYVSVYFILFLFVVPCRAIVNPSTDVQELFEGFISKNYVFGFFKWDFFLCC